MGTLVNGDIPSMETPGKRRLEKIEPDVPTLAYKCYKPSANRKFPKGCGPFALKINEKLREVGPVENSKHALVETIFVKPLGDSVEPGSLNADKSTAVESFQVSKSLISKTTKSIEGSDAVEGHEWTKLLEIPKVLEEIKNGNLSKTLEPEISESSKQGTTFQSLEGSTNNNYSLRRRTTACRDFPQGCEKNAPCVMKGDCQKSVVSSADKSLASVFKEECQKSVNTSKVKSSINGKGPGIDDDAAQIMEKVEDGDALEKKLNIISTEGSVDEVQAVLEGELWEETIGPIHVEVASENKLKREGTTIKCNRTPCKSDISLSDFMFPSNIVKVDLGFHNESVVVQCLKVAPSCPLMEEKKSFKPCSLMPAMEKRKSLRRTSACRDFPQGCERNAPCVMKEECQKSAVSSSDNGLAIVTKEECQKSAGSSPDHDLAIITKEEYDKSVVMEEGDKSVGSSMDRSLIIITKEEYQQSVISSKERSFIDRMEKAVGGDIKQTRERVWDGDILGRKLEGINTKECEEVRELLNGEVNKEIVEHNHVSIATEIKLKRRTRSSSRSLCESDISLSDFRSPSNKGKSDLECLMTAQNCPSVQGKQGVESPSSITHPTTRSNAKTQELKSTVESKKQEVKSLEESVLLQNATGLERKNSGKTIDECHATNQPKGQECVDLGFFNESMVVQGFMAAPNSPCGATRSEGKNQVIVVKDNTKSTSKRKIDEAGTSKGKSMKKKVSPTIKAAHEGDSQLVLKNFSDFSCDDKKDGKHSLVQKSLDRDLSLIPLGIHSLADKDDKSESVVTRKKVKETLRLFQAIYRKLMQEEEAKSKEGQINSSGRFNLLCATASILKEKNKWVNTGKQILGSVPGVEVGDEFNYRAELAVIGLHRQFQGGIDYLTGKHLATSIVASGVYGDDMDSSDVLRYSGQGGNPTGVDKKAEDQKLVRGNLALKNSMDERSPVRVIRGFKENKKTSAAYVYDGLYMVERFWQETGCYGNNVFMFELRRILGQPELALKELKKSKKSKVREGMCVADISEGKEKMPICAVNTIDHEKPPPFKYITSIIYPLWYNHTPPRGCECINGCSDSEECLCAVRNGGEIPYNHDGAIVEAKHLVHECGPLCKCPPSCHNRVSQRGIKFQLEIFKTESRGWGVRSLTSIPSGSFICEYAGELLQDTEAEERTGNDEYLFDIGNNYNDPFWEGVSTVMSSDFKASSSGESVEDADFTIDAAQYGSIGRFINHSCSPNLYAQNVLYDHKDKRMPHIMLFAADNVPPLEELTYHYNYQLDQVRDSDGNIKKKDCYCGAVDCTGRLY